MKKLLASILCLGLAAMALPKTFTQPAAKNIALGKKATFLAPPNYQLCTDAEDNVQLTDGKYIEGRMWGQKGCVGWRNSAPETPRIIKERPVGFTIDLGKVEPIQGFMYSTVAGVAEITFPYYICIYTSEDGREWHYTGDLVRKSAREYGQPPEDEFFLHKYASLKMPTKGRYVAFVMKANNYVFIDEIEIYRGEKHLLDLPQAGPVVSDILLHNNNQSFTPYQKRLFNDVYFLDQAIYPELCDVLDGIEKEIEALSSFDCRKMTTIMPLSDLQRKIFALNTVRLKKEGFASPTIWRNNRWDNLAPMAIPPKDRPAPLAVEMMRGEIRGETFNIVNPTDAPQKYEISVVGLPKDAAIDCREVLYTDTYQSLCSSSALKLGDGESISIEIASGISTQIWISFKRPACKAGTYNGKVVAKGINVLEIPISLTIHDFDFPARPRIHVGGWDYTEGNGGFFGMPQRLEDNLKFMRDMYVDSPWAHANVAPKGEKFDEAGHLVNKNELDYTEWDRWTKRWHDARLYCIFMHVAGPHNDKEASWHGEMPGV
ncbi:MAG: hypothetical protein J5833_00180, partial [Victivallales bacterium]|nr:hypothetical protein [Victivallales bacterium]